MVAFDRMTALDFVGFYDPVTRLKSMGFLPGLEWRICGLRPRVRDDRGLVARVDAVGAPLGGYDLLFVPGGFAASDLETDDAFIAWLRTGADADLKVSVCSGSLLLGAAGFLRGKRATAHPCGLERLRPYCEDVVRARVVDDGDVITGGGVTSSIDVGLHVVERLTDVETRAAIARQMDYPYGPPAGSRGRETRPG